MKKQTPKPRAAASAGAAGAPGARVCAGGDPGGGATPPSAKPANKAQLDSSFFLTRGNFINTWSSLRFT